MKKWLGRAFFLPQANLKTVLTQAQTELQNQGLQQADVFIVSKYFDRLKNFRLGGSVAQVVDQDFENSYTLCSDKNLSLAAASLVISLGKGRDDLSFLNQEYEDEKVIAGQGTIGLEIFQQIPQLDLVIVPIGGGGLISGIAIALKALNPGIKVIGVQSAHVNTMEQLFKTHQFTLEKNLATIADGIAVQTPSQNMFDSFISKYVDDIVSVTEGEIAESIVFLLERAKTVAEGAGAAAVAALLSKKVKPLKKTCAIVCGGNIDLNIISQVIQRGQIQRGRLCEMSVIVSDTPGSLARLTQVLAESKANIIKVHHDRVKQGLSLKETRIEFVIETIGHEHIEKIRQNLIKMGARVVSEQNKNTD